MISNGSTDANREILIEGVGEHRLPPSCADSGDWPPAVWAPVPEMVISTHSAT